MEGKKKYIAIILFLLIGLGVFTFANPDEELGTNNGSNNGGQQQVETDDNDDNTQDVLEEVEEDNDNNTGSNNNINNVVTRNDAYAKALAAVQKLEQVLTEKQAETARDLVEEVTNSKQYADLIARVENAEDAMDATKLVEELEKMVEEAAARTDIENAATNRDDVVTPAIEKIEGENLEGVKEELTKRVEALAKLLDDSTAPTVEPDVNGTTTNKDVALVITDAEGNEFTATVTKDGQTYELKETFTEDGIYEVKVVDAAFNEDTITFTIDKTAPQFVGLESREAYVDSYKVEVNDATEVTIMVKKDHATEWSTIAEGTELTEEGTYQIKAEDAAGNAVDTWVIIDKSNPTISGIDGALVNKTQTILVEDRYLYTVEINGKKYTRKDFTHNVKNEYFKFEITLSEDGVYTIIAKDKSGKTTPATFEIDTESNRLKETSIQTAVQDKENAKMYYAKNGDTITVYARFTELLGEDATLKIAGQEAKFVYSKEIKSQKLYEYKATITIPADEKDLEEGQLTFVIENVTDEAGNKGFYYKNATTLKEKLTAKETTASKFVIYDRTPNRLSETSIQTAVQDKENAKMYYAKNGDTITVYARFTELLGEDATLKIAGQEVKLTYSREIKSQKLYEYTATVTIPADEKDLAEGQLTFVIENVTDKAGHTMFYYKKAITLSEKLTAKETTASKFVIYDRTPNRLSETSIKTDVQDKDNKKIYYAKNGDSITVYARFTELLDEDAVLKIAGQEVKLTYSREIKSQKLYEYTATVTIPADEKYLAEGQLTFVIENVTDKAGHTMFYYKKATTLSEKLTTKETTAGKFVVYDRTKVKVNGLENATFTYDGVGIILTSEDNDIKTITLTKDGSVVEGYKLSDSIINAGEYKLTIVDRAGNVTEETFVINKAQTTITMTPEEGTEFRYDATAKLATAVVNKVGSTENLNVTYKDDKGYKHTEPVKPGKYTATAVYAGDENHEGSEASVNYRIIKAASSIAFTSEPESLVYDGTAKEFGATVTLVNGTTSATMTYYDAEGNKLDGAPVNAGSYKVVASFKGDTLHDEVKKPLEKEFTIEKAQYVIKLEEPSLVYNGKKQEYVVRVFGADGNEILEPNMNVAYTQDKKVLPEAPINAGTYRIGVHVRESENHIITNKWTPFTVSKAEYVIKLEEPSLVYNGKKQEYVVRVFGADGNEILEPNMNVVYTTGNKEVLPEAPINAGTYRIGVHVRESENHIITNKWTPFTVSKAQYVIKLEEPSLVYNGQKQEYGVKVYDVNGNEILEPNMNVAYTTGNKEVLPEAPINAGTYRIGVHVRESENYAITNKWTPFTVEQKKLDFEFAMDKVIRYDGTPKTAVINVLNAESENDYQVKISFYEMNSKGQYVGPLSGVTSVTDSGIYRVKVTLEAVNPNYKSSNTKKFDFYIEDKANILNLNRNLLLVDEPYYNNVTNTTPVEINGNGYTVHHIATGSVDLRQWGYTPGSEVENHALMGTVFSSSNGSSLTVKNLTLTGETQSVSLGHYVRANAAAQSNYNTTLTNVNIVGLEVVSYSAPGITPGVVVYGKAVLNNTNIYGTKFSKQDTLKWPIYDLVLTNYTDTTINGGKIGTIFTWNHAGLKINGAEVDTILTATTKSRATNGIFVNSGSKVNLIDVNENDPYVYKAKIVIESGATVNTLDLRGTTDAANIDIKDGAIVNKIITDNGEMTLEEWKAL